ncbi:scaffolding protein [Romboutsia maritimum]|uniref:Scaffolding protein n=1 Tax=Romboutsia maritimum TaxID=2020948 RepID=A0A371IQX4_9FIRM|nr:phage scaffolding protein [Romboutsia maritimum]RDY22876.1 scaffolding protein [Romboutsia maritimum]
MNLEELLGTELYKQVTEKLGDKKIMLDDGNFIPKSRFDQVNEAKKELETQVKDRDKQLKDLSTKAQGNEELTKQIEQLQLLNKQTQTDYEAKINQMQFGYALDSELTNAKCKNTKALKALLDIDSIKYQEGKFEGLESQLEGLRESDSYLFDLDAAPGNTGSPGNFGRNNNNPSGGDSQTSFMEVISNNSLRK